MDTKLSIVIVAILLGFAVLYFYINPGKEDTNESIPKNQEEINVEVAAENLKIPWEMAFLPEGTMLVTERPGTLLRIGKDRVAHPVEGVVHIGEGGLLGMALHPKFSENRWIYLFLTTVSGGGLKNRVERYRFEADRLSERKIIIDNILGAAFHDGGRIAFAPDGYLYITTGDATRMELSQDINSLAGKILRLKDDGSTPTDNPFGNAVWSYGHRNPQGLAWDDQGRLWATEHGRSTLTLSGMDELNLIEKGKNYGWPDIEGDAKKEGMENPVIHSGPDVTWAPAAAVFYQGRIFFTGLRGASLYEAVITPEGKVASFQAHFEKKFGRLRALTLGPDGFFYFSTSNTDGRGKPQARDDKIFRVDPRVFLR